MPVDIYFEHPLRTRYGMLFTRPDAEFSSEFTDTSVRASKLTLTLDAENSCLIMNANGVFARITVPGWGDDSVWQDRRKWLLDHLEHWCDIQGGSAKDVDPNSKYTVVPYESDPTDFDAAVTMTDEDRIYGFGEAADKFPIFNGKTV